MQGLNDLDPNAQGRDLHRRVATCAAKHLLDKELCINSRSMSGVLVTSAGKTRLVHDGKCDMCQSLGTPDPGGTVTSVPQVGHSRPPVGPDIASSQALWVGPTRKLPRDVTSPSRFVPVSIEGSSSPAPAAAAPASSAMAPAPRVR